VGYKRKILKKFLMFLYVASTDDINFKFFHWFFNEWENNNEIAGISRAYELIQEICQRILVLWAYNYQNCLVSFLRRTTFFFVTLYVLYFQLLWESIIIIGFRMLSYLKIAFRNTPTIFPRASLILTLHIWLLQMFNRSPTLRDLIWQFIEIIENETDN